jgi:hypothetical protein
MSMENIIHMDDKWYNNTSKYTNYYMLPGEDDPHRIVQNKNRIGKVMFLTALGRPIYDDEGSCIFDGKIGTWPYDDEGSCIFDGKIGTWPFIRKVQLQIDSLSYISLC